MPEAGDAAITLHGIDALVIGASAGGVDALLRLLPTIPAAARAAVIVVLHLPRGQRSSLVEIFTPRCRLPVREVDDKDRVAAGVVHVAPPDYHVLIDRDAGRAPIFALSVDEPVNYSRPSIDVLFESAADFYGERLAGILLTGANADGAAGIAAIRREGGTTIAQDPVSAYAATMPAAAIARGAVDRVLPLDAIAALLGTLAAGRG